MILGGGNRNNLLGEKNIPVPHHVRHAFDPESVHVGFVVDKVALWQVSIQVLGAFLFYYCASPPYSLIYPPPMLYKLGNWHRYIKHFSVPSVIFVMYAVISTAMFIGFVIVRNNWGNTEDMWYQMFLFLGAFAKLWKAILIFVMSVRLSAWNNSAAATERILWHLVFEYNSKICQESSSFIKIWQE
jgi:hypothetical protein